MGLSFSNVFTPATAAQWLAQYLTNASIVGLSTSSWQSGGMARTLIAIFSNLLSVTDGVVSISAQGGFLDFAATGTVQYTNPSTGQVVTAYVTPDPAFPNQWPVPGQQPQPGWLDFLADSTYDIQRIAAVAAAGQLTFANISGASQGPYQIGNYHVGAPGLMGSPTYSNTSALTIATSPSVGGSITGATNTSPITITTTSAHGLASGAQVYIANVLVNTAANGFWTATVTGANTITLAAPNGLASSGNGVGTGGAVYTPQTYPFAADLAGRASSANPGSIVQPITALVGVACSNFTLFTGFNIENNVAVASRCRLKSQALSPNGPAGAYQFFALQAYVILQDQSLGGVTQTQSLLSAPITQAIEKVDTTTGIVTTIIANATGTPPGVTGLAVLGATDASPIVVTVATTAGMGTVGSIVNVKLTGVGGNTAANGYWQATIVNSSTFSLANSTGNGVYTSGGSVESGDLGLVDSILQANVVPNGVTAVTYAATAQPITVVITVWVPAAQASNIVGSLNLAIPAYFGTIPIGGFTVGVPTTNSVPVNGVLEAVFAAGSSQGSPSYVRDATVTLNGSAADAVVGNDVNGYPKVPTISGGLPTINVNVF